LDGGPVPDQISQTPLFALRHLSFTYPDGTPGLRDISLDIFPATGSRLSA
jgi:hypothetical protein